MIVLENREWTRNVALLKGFMLMYLEYKPLCYAPPCSVILYDIIYVWFFSEWGAARWYKRIRFSISDGSNVCQVLSLSFTAHHLFLTKCTFCRFPFGDLKKASRCEETKDAGESDDDSEEDDDYGGNDDDDVDDSDDEDDDSEDGSGDDSDGDSDDQADANGDGSSDDDDDDNDDEDDDDDDSDNEDDDGDSDEEEDNPPLKKMKWATNANCLSEDRYVSLIELLFGSLF